MNTLGKQSLLKIQSRNVVPIQQSVLLSIHFVVRAHENLFERCLLYFCKLLHVMWWLSLKNKSAGSLLRLWDYRDTYTEAIVAVRVPLKKIRNDISQSICFFLKKRRKVPTNSVN